MELQAHTEFPPLDDWAERCRYWLKKSETEKPFRKKRDRQKAPLILTGEGLSIHVDKGRLVIKDGFTHYPQPLRELSFFKGSLELPPRIVLLDGSGSITLDALDWLAEQCVALIRIRFDGESVTAINQTGFAADQTLVDWQRATRDDPKARLAFGADLIARKLEASLETLADFVPASKACDRTLAVTEECLTAIRSGRIESVSALLGQEGKAANAYWAAWGAVEMCWKATSRYPVPDDWRCFSARSSLNTSKKQANRNASHPINAMLNYAYSALFTDMKIKALVEGYDPTIGVLHDQREAHKQSTASFALDLMEPERPVVDRAVLKLVRDEVFSGADFVLRSDGVMRLGPELTRLVVANLGLSGSTGQNRAMTTL